MTQNPAPEGRRLVFGIASDLTFFCFAIFPRFRTWFFLWRGNSRRMLSVAFTKPGSALPALAMGALQHAENIDNFLRGAQVAYGVDVIKKRGANIMLKRILATIAVAAALSTPASGATISFFTDGVQDNIPGLTGFTTTGDLMAGMTVQACFSNVGCGGALVWAAGGGTSGGVSTALWSLSVAGDTFNANAWSFIFNDPNGTLGQLVSLTLDGGPFTVFDRTNPNQGTPGSAQGLDFDTGIAGFIDVTYHDAVAIIPGGPVGDLYHSMTIAFTGGSGPRESFLFSQDADNDARITVPEPTTLALLGIASLGLALSRRRRT